MIRAYVSGGRKTPGEHGTTCRRASWHHSVCLIEPYILLCQPVDNGSHFQRKTFPAAQIGTLLIGHNNHNIRFAGLRLG